MIIQPYLKLMRLDKPIGIFLLLWPTLWALWLAGAGSPQFSMVMIFIMGVIIMRSAGCIINDIADRHIDKYVERTRYRPLATQHITVKSAFVLFGCLCLVALLLVCQLNAATIGLAFIGALLTIVYPFMKRFTHLPQLGLGVAFAWGVPMAFTALSGHVTKGWWVFLAAAIWPVIYDTMYAMVDQRDDIKVGIKSTAILFGSFTVSILASLQIVFIMTLFYVGVIFGLHWPYYISLILVSGLSLYQLRLIRDSDPQQCFKAFLNNHWLGFIVFCGILLSFWL